MNFIDDRELAQRFAKGAGPNWERFTYLLIDADRAKSDHQADYQYFRDYIARLRQTAGGQVPKL